MKSILKNFYSSDIGIPLSDYIPVTNDNFCILARLIVGEAKLGGEESFDITICTPKWLISNHDDSDIIIGRHYLIVFEYNYQRIFSKLKTLVETTRGDTWDEIGSKIGRIGRWEFEDYKEQI
ncbi:MAG: hypothetical protein CVV22_10000 [Ignavibacteriae bacterium HGW-Ignavibacteriae-1]|jgi:hypothetical protein|nr:MAG: hypothetical protein CVV22_10000 [Ignavibacteriae bacterium HGW-Ignavibacteriae-1]